MLRQRYRGLPLHRRDIKLLLQIAYLLAGFPFFSQAADHRMGERVLTIYN